MVAEYCLAEVVVLGKGVVFLPSHTNMPNHPMHSDGEKQRLAEACTGDGNHIYGSAITSSPLVMDTL